MSWDFSQLFCPQNECIQKLITQGLPSFLNREVFGRREGNFRSIKTRLLGWSFGITCRGQRQGCTHVCFRSSCLEFNQLRISSSQVLLNTTIWGIRLQDASIKLVIQGVFNNDKMYITHQTPREQSSEKYVILLQIVLRKFENSTLISSCWPEKHVIPNDQPSSLVIRNYVQETTARLYACLLSVIVP